MSLREKTINGLFWSFTDNFVNLGGQFLIGIILARLLTPREYGLIGMLSIFIAISQSFIDSGFSSALIRKKDCTQTDYSTVFYFSLAVSLFCYVLLYLFSSSISSFFQEPQLKLLIRVLGLGLILNSFGFIQSAILTKNINFKLQTKVSMLASVGSGIIAIILAYKGFGVWSLVALTLSRYTISSLFLWIWTKWKPLWLYSKQSFKELFAFGSKLLLSGLIDTTYRNIYNVVIGKYFSALELGYFSRADMFQSFPSQNLQGIIGRVSYPILSGIQDDKIQLKTNYKKLIRMTMLITFMLMFGMAVVAKPMVLTLIGEKWQPCVIYLQMLCFVGIFYPLGALNLNILKVEGRSDLFLNLEIIKKIIAIPVIITGILFGIKALIIGMLVHSIISYYINSFWSGKLIDYSIIEQIMDILPAFALALIVNTLVFLSGFIINFSDMFLLIFQIAFGGMLAVCICELFKFQDYLYAKDIVYEHLSKGKKKY
jgi:teichuronic acid exporter